MATPLDLLLSFNTGQGVAGGKSQYVNYPIDLDTNFTGIQTTVNQLIDEVNVAKLPNAAITTDLLLDAAITTQGRYLQNSATVTRTSGVIVTIGSGTIFAGGARVDVTGEAIDFTGSANGTYYIATDENGVLTTSTTVNNKVFDIATVVWDGSLVDADVTDNLYNNGRTLGSTNSGAMQEHFIPPNGESAITNTAYPGREAPTVRYMDNAGTFGDSGFFVGDTDEWWFVSQQATSAGVGDTVLGAHMSARAQLQLFEQARLILTNNSASAGTSNALTALSMTARRQEPASYGATLWGSSPATSYTVPNDTQYAGTYSITAWVEFNAAATGTVEIDVQIGGTTVALARADVPTTGNASLTVNAIVDVAGNQSVALRASQGGGTLTVVNAELGMQLIGGRATP